jgi:hypothetical protein
VNAALLEVAFLSGLISKIYYTFLSDVSIYGKYLQPPSKVKDNRIFCWDDVPFAKTDFDERYYQIPRELSKIGTWCTDEELLKRLRNDEYFKGVDIGRFRWEFLNKMDERELEREVRPDGSLGDQNRLSDYGQRVLQMIDDPLFKALTHRGRGLEEDVTHLSEGLELEELWSKP